ncbi:Uncharacterized conserved protein YbjT, contains NAD(P)-binding and DUF2867 domains [Chryseolinea serpens]|uniref:Uncharacterized conserved protein YbjT, contains NAD(P)-binding and DUF2867 domains n=1 Tax=Chryseolinea serpens TaxID=947013 RepID=A0A1M5MUY1_9BACT|nr:SDR family oxidoreductase [Chryseolinea serpens]SHG81170.1 Uncharacterized conserved protein YbjT, contains NAD(P)-binding and DUF2867 domains [Chryseolinea serpens]
MENKNNITVFGATGRIGKELLKLLSQAQISVTAVTRDKNKAVIFPGVVWVEADMSDKASLAAALRGSRAVFLVSSVGKDFVTQQNNVIEAAQKLGVGHLVKLSSGVADKESPLYIPRVHGEVEAFLQTSGLPYTILRANGMMQNWLGELAESVKLERKFYESTGDGKRAYVDIRDIAEVAFKVLTAPQAHNNKTHLLTSDEAVNYDQVARALSDVVGEAVTYVPISLDEAGREMKESGMPGWAVETFLAYDQAQRNGQAEFVSRAVQDILAKPARTIEDFVLDYADRFR